MADQLPECPHGDLIDASFACAPCQTTHQGRRRAAAITTPITHAFYAARCPGCGDRIHEGDRIWHDGDDWLCWGCRG